MRGPSRHVDPYMPEGEDGSRELTPDEKCQQFTAHVQPKALRFPPYHYREYPKWVGQGKDRRLVHGPGEETPQRRSEPVQLDPPVAGVRRGTSGG